ncbi:MAG TPA: protein kinase [Gemmatimonadales bacterium]|nr:protein kinase [Gemmatimonadales bacterium]
MTAVAERLAQALADRYRIERELGQGGMATVYLAHDLKHDRRVALKVLKPELAAVLGAERFVQEIKTTAALQHPNILPLFDSGTADGFLYYVMPYIQGETIREKLNRETQFDIDESVRIATEVAGALEHAHQQGVIHRDIKPENLLLQDGRAMVADFGIALAVSAAAGGRMTETGLSLGTPHYMSPEQATAEKDLSARSDVYSLASVLYEMLTGSPPHVGASAQQIIMKIVTDQARPVTELRKSVPPHVAAATAKALEKLPADRFASAAAFAAALSNPAFTLAATAGTPAGRLAAPGGRRAAWVVAAVLAVIGLVNAGLLLRRDQPVRQVVRFRLDTPGTHQIVLQGDEDVAFALSPDGTRIVYSGRDSGSTTLRLYIRALDQVEGVPLQGTEDGIAPFFSPDGLWVGFATEEDEKLKKVPVSGGPAITLAEDVQERAGGGSWGDDGNIVYTSNDFRLSRVPGTGGVSAPLAGRDSVPGGMLWPSVLPGGGAILFEHCLGQCSQHDLAVLDVATGSMKIVVPGATRGWYIGTGHLVYATEAGALYAAPFDLERRTVTGPPVPVLDQVSSGIAFGSRVAISPAGAMAYLPGATEGGVRVVEVDRSGRSTEVIGRPGRYDQPRWAPGGDRIAVAQTSDAGSQILIYDLRSETLSPLTSVGNNIRPWWSPDGGRIAFYSTRGDTIGLYWMAADRSSLPEKLGEADSLLPQGASTTFWTRDGAWIVVDGETARSGDEDIVAVATGDRTVRMVVGTPADEQSGAVSPDGRWIAYLSNEGGPYQVYVRPFLREGGRWQVSTGAAGAPLWASSTELVYPDQTSGTLMAATLQFDGSVRVARRERLFELGGYTGLYNISTPGYDVSRDGQRFLMLSRGNGTRNATTPIVTLNWFEEVRRRMAEQGGK